MQHQPNTFLVPPAPAALARAYQDGVNAGYAMAVAEEVLQIQAMKRQEEREAIIALQGLSEAREGDEP